MTKIQINQGAQRPQTNVDKKLGLVFELVKTPMRQKFLSTTLRL